MALDEAVSESVRKEDSPPTLRLYGWDKPSLTIGCFQKTSKIDIEFCRKKHIPIVRRPTGGRAILHHIELTYSFSSRPEGPFKGGVNENYKILSKAFALAFSRLGIDAAMDRSKRADYSRNPICFRSSSFGELSSGGIKLIGSAQKKWADGFLQQGSIPFEADYGLMRDIFPEKAESFPRDAKEGLSYIAPSITAEELKRAIASAFEKCFGIGFAPSSPTAEEYARADVLVKDKYSNPQWNLSL